MLEKARQVVTAIDDGVKRPPRYSCKVTSHLSFASDF